MKKILLALMVASSFSIAGLIDGIALTVNNKPVTLYDIEKVKDRFKFDSRKSAEFLVRRVIMEEELKKNNPSFDLEALINTEIVSRASNLKLTAEEFKRRLEDKGFSWDEYREDIKTELLKLKFNELVMEKRLVPIPKDSELQGFYNTNMQYFTKANTISIVEYKSNSEDALEYVKNNPMATLPEVTTRQREIQIDDNPALANLLNDTKEGTFTKNIKISREANEFITLFVVKKSNVETMKFEDAKNKIKDVLFSQKSQKAVDDYLQKLKSEAEIKIVR